MNSEAVIILMKLRKAKEEVEQLEKEYRKVCECNMKLNDRQFNNKNDYQKLYRTCDYHKVKISKELRHASV